MRNDTPPPMDNADEYQDDMFLNEDDIEIIEDFEIEEEFGPVVDFEPLPVHDDANLTFAAHTGAVFCCEIDKTCGIAVSGGEDDRGFIWDIATGETLLECSGHKDSVISVGFNHNKTLVATADMGGVIQVWDVQNKIRVWEFETSDLTWLEWHKQSNVLLAGTQDGDTWMWRVPQGEFKTFRSHGSASSYGRIMPDGCRSVVGYDDGSVRFWDLKKSTLIHTIVDQRSQEGSVTTIDCHPDNVLVVTGSTDCIAKLIKSTNGRVLASFHCGEEQVSVGVRTDSIESASFFNSHSLLATGTLHGSLAIWDLPTQVQRLQCKQESAIVKLLCDRTDPLVFTAGMDGIIRLYDWRTGQVEAKWGGHTSEILDFSLSRDGQTILTASEDKTCKIFAVRQS